MAALRTVLLEKFSTFGNPIVSLAATFASFFSAPSANPQSVSSSDPTPPISFHPTPLQSSQRIFISEKSKRKMHVPRNNLRQLVEGENDFAQTSPSFIHALDLMYEIDIDEQFLEKLPLVDSDSEDSEEIIGRGGMNGR